MSDDAAIPDSDVTSSGLLALVISTLRLKAPELLPDEIAMPDCALAHAPASIKRRLLTAAYEARGADFILGMGQRIKQIGFDPVMHVMRRSATPQVMAGKFQRFEQFTHSRHRCEIEADGEGGLAVRRYAVSGPPPAAVENLLIAGLLQAMLERLIARTSAVRESHEHTYADHPYTTLRAMLATRMNPEVLDPSVAMAILTAVAEQPALLDPLRQHIQQMRERILAENGDSPTAWLLWAAADGLMFQELLDISPVPADQRDRLHQQLQLLAEDLLK